MLLPPYIYLITPTVMYLNPCYTCMIFRHSLDLRYNFKIGTQFERPEGWENSST